MIGVSPAYFISRFGTDFTPRDVVKGVSELKALGFECFQLEIYHDQSLDEWVSSGFSDVLSAAGKEGLAVSQFVAHFLLNAFSDERSLCSPRGINEAAIIAEALSGSACPLVTIPVPAFEIPRGKVITAAYLRDIEKRFMDKLVAMVETFERFSLKAALEVMPWSLVGGIHGFLRIAETLSRAGGANIRLGFNLDTGHANACKEPLIIAVSRLGACVLGTHLCDNYGYENLSLAPGKGLVQWDSLFATLRDIGYSGSYDLEIRCEAADVYREYSAAREFVADRLSSGVATA